MLFSFDPFLLANITSFLDFSNSRCIQIHFWLPGMGWIEGTRIRFKCIWLCEYTYGTVAQHVYTFIWDKWSSHKSFIFRIRLLEFIYINTHTHRVTHAHSHARTAIQKYGTVNPKTDNLNWMLCVRVEKSVSVCLCACVENIFSCICKPHVACAGQHSPA